MSNDPYNLYRFLAAQQSTYATALAELRQGRKTSHWMWFIFPQVAGLGRSPTAQHYAIASLDEARAYLEHPTLGDRMRECVRTLEDLPHGSSADSAPCSHSNCTVKPSLNKRPQSAHFLRVCSV